MGSMLIFFSSSLCSKQGDVACPSFTLYLLENLAEKKKGRGAEGGREGRREDGRKVGRKGGREGGREKRGTLPKIYRLLEGGFECTTSRLIPHPATRASNSSKPSCLSHSVPRWGRGKATASRVHYDETYACFYSCF